GTRAGRGGVAGAIVVADQQRDCGSRRVGDRYESPLGDRAVLFVAADRRDGLVVPEIQPARGAEKERKRDEQRQRDDPPYEPCGRAPPRRRLPVTHDRAQRFQWVDGESVALELGPASEATLQRRSQARRRVSSTRSLRGTVRGSTRPAHADNR